jgi:hypothetical protein
LPGVGGALGTDPWGNTKVYLREAPPRTPYPLMIVSPIATIPRITNSPTTTWKIKRIQYDLFDTSADSLASLGEAAYSALSQVSQKVVYSNGYEFLRIPLSHGEPTLITISGRSGLPEYRYMFEIQHQVGELY